ncbi:MAG: acyltransferase family protein [Opitutales bacterium]|jgi:predicted acyltransferase
METPAPKSERLLSLDALRGFDLFWIVGGHGILVALFKLTEWGWLGAIDAQLKHVDWNGFQAYDLIFPLFLFMAGVSTPYSLTRRLTEGARSEVCRKIVQRGLILVLLGVIYNNGLQWKGLESMRFGSVLGRIGLAGMFAQLIFAFNFETPKRLWYWLAGILLGYWAIMSFGHAPGFAAGDLTMEGNFASYVDRLLLPGKLHKKIHDPEGLLAMLPAIGNALLGVLAGLWLRRSTEEVSGDRKAAGLAIAGLGLLAVGGLWSFVFPLNKNLWTSSFVLWTCGWGSLLLALFYWTIDVRGWARGFGAFFAVIGMNSVLIYLSGKFLSYDYTARAFFGGIAAAVSPAVGTLVLAVGVFAVEWALFWFLKRQKIFLKV